MTYRRRTILIASALLCIAVAHAFAQGKKKPATKPAAKPVVNASDKAINVNPQLKEYDSTNYHYFLFPQFYSYWPIANNDTILRFECYNTEGNFVNMDTLYDVGELKHIYFTKTYDDYTQTVIDFEGRPKPKPISKKIYQYTRTGADTWSAIDLIYQVPSTLVEYKNDIVKTDTTIIVDRVNGTRQVTIRKYYKVLEVDQDNVSREAPVTIQSATDMVNNAAAPSAAHFVSVYYVPEFYFAELKTNKDTVLEFKCYDSRDSEINNVINYDSVRYYSLFKSYTDSAHTYKDKNGEKKLLPVSSIIRRYDHLAENKWMSIEYPGNKYQELTVFKDNIVRRDTMTIEDPITGSTIQKAFNYYKVSK